jgi:hypothetical protein
VVAVERWLVVLEERGVMFGFHYIMSSLRPGFFIASRDIVTLNGDMNFTKRGNLKVFVRDGVRSKVPVLLYSSIRKM